MRAVFGPKPSHKIEVIDRHVILNLKARAFDLRVTAAGDISR